MRTPSRRIEIIRSPPIKKKFINWLRKEESSGKWVREVESPITPISQYSKTFKNPISKVHQNQNFINSPNSQISLKHSLKATIKTPSKTRLFQPTIISKSQSQAPSKHYSISPKPNKTKRSSRKYIKSKRNIPSNKNSEILYGSVYDNKSETPNNLNQFRSCQDHRLIDFTSISNNNYLASPQSKLINLRF
jgi:hypothetical protein